MRPGNGSAEPRVAVDRLPRGDPRRLGRPEMSVVVCTFSDDRAQDLLAAIASLRRQTTPPAEIVVVVDHNPALLRWVRERAADVASIENEGPSGLSEARNTGVRVSRGDVVAFLDDDAVAEPDLLGRLGSAYGDDAVVGVGGAALPLWDGARPGWFPDEFGWVVGCSYRGLPERRAPVRNLIGCNMSFRRDALVEIGGFVRTLGRVRDRPLGCEETELCIRLGRRFPRSRLLYDPQAVVRHRVPATRATPGYFRRRCYAEGLSKAAVTRMVGQRRGLSSERAYAARVLPDGLAASLRAAWVHHEAAALARGAAILAGLGITTAGYLAGRLGGRG